MLFLLTNFNDTVSSGSVTNVVATDFDEKYLCVIKKFEYDSVGVRN